MLCLVELDCFHELLGRYSLDVVFSWGAVGTMWVVLLSSMGTFLEHLTPKTTAFGLFVAPGSGVEPI